MVCLQQTLHQVDDFYRTWRGVPAVNSVRVKKDVVAVERVQSGGASPRPQRRNPCARLWYGPVLIETAAARIREARAREIVAGAATLPQVDAQASASRQRISENAIPIPPGSGGGSGGGGNTGTFGLPGSEFNTFRVGFDASWEIDLFGKTRRSIEAARARTGTAIWNRRDVQVSVAALFKEILYYAFDPLMARVSGVRTGAIHYLLMLLLAITIIIGMRIVGSILITAVLILPGATALLLSRRLSVVMSLSVFAGFTSSVGGLAVSHRWPLLQSGPSIVLFLFVEFLLAYAWARLPRLRPPAHPVI